MREYIKMRKQKKTSFNNWLDYWREPQITTRSFVLLLVMMTAIPFIGIFIFFFLLNYSLVNSIDRLIKGGKTKNGRHNNHKRNKI